MAEPERVSTAVNGSWVSRSRRLRHLAKGGTSRGLKLRLVKQWVFRPLFSCSYLERSSCVIFLGLFRLRSCGRVSACAPVVFYLVEIVLGTI